MILLAAIQGIWSALAIATPRAVLGRGRCSLRGQEHPLSLIVMNLTASLKRCRTVAVRASARMDASLNARRKPPPRVPHCPAFAETLSDYRHEKTQSETGLLESYGRLGMLLKRRGWDSNPRRLAPRWFSRPEPSTTRPPLQGSSSGGPRWTHCIFPCFAAPAAHRFETAEIAVHAEGRVVRPIGRLG